MTPEEYKAHYAAQAKKDAETAADKAYWYEEFTRRRKANLKVWIPLATCGRTGSPTFVFDDLDALWCRESRCWLIRYEGDLPIIRDRLDAKGFDLVEAPNGGWTSQKRETCKSSK